MTPQEQPREAHGVWDSLVSGVQGAGTGLFVRGELPDVVLNPHNAKWYETALSTVAGVAADLPQSILGLFVGSTTGAAVGTAVAPGPGTAAGAVLGGGAGMMAVPAEIRESLMRAYNSGQATSSSDWLDRAGIVIRGLADQEVMKATAKSALVGAATLGAGKVAAPLGAAAKIAAEAGTLTVAPAALEGHLPEPQDFVNAAIVLGGLKAAGSIASKLATIYEKTGVRPEEVVSDAQKDPTIREDLGAPEMREWTGAPTKEELMAKVPEKDFGLPPEEVAASKERMMAAITAKHAEMGVDDVPRAYQAAAREEHARAAVPGVEKAQQFVEQPFAEIPQAAGEPTLSTHINYNYTNTSLEVDGALSRLSQLWKDKIQEERRGEVPREQTYAEAGDILNRMIGGEDVTVKALRGALTTDHELGARVLAKKQLAIGAAENIMQMRDAYLKNPTPENKLQYLASIERSATILSNFLGERAEIGRALEILKSTKTDAERVKQLNQLIETYKKDPDQLAIAMGMMDSPGALLKAARDAVKPTMWDKLMEYFKASIVSGPWTQVANLVGNTTFMAVRPVIEQVAAGIGLVGGKDRVLMIQPASRVIGNINGAFEIAKMASKVYQTEQNILHGSWAVLKAAWRSGDRSQKAEVAQGGAIPGKLGTVIRSPFQVLGAADSMFKTLNERGELYSLASKVATEEGLSPMSREFWTRVSDIVTNPTEGQVSAARDAGLRMTFNLPLGEKGQAAQKFIRAWHLQWAAPFTQTPGNIAKEMARMTPLAPFIGEWREAFAKGGAERDKAIAELAVGSALMTATVAMFNAGKITGGSTGSSGEKNAKQSAGMQPYSVEVNGKWYDYSRIQPVGTIVGLAADMANGWKKFDDGEQDKVPKIMATAFASAITNQTMLQGLTMMVNALSEPDRFFPRMAQSYSASMVPFSGAMRQTAEAMDKEQRRIDGIRDAVYAAVPLRREQLLPKIDPMTGETMPTKERTLGQRTQEGSTDKVLTEAARLGVGIQRSPKNIQLPSPDKKIGKVTLSPEQQNVFETTAGRLAHQVLSRLVEAPMWDGLPDLQKKKIYATVFKDARKRGAAKALPGEDRAEVAQEIADSIEESMK